MGFENDAFVMPNGWKLTQPWTEKELLDMINTIENLALQQPFVDKFHAKRTATNVKKNVPYFSYNYQTELPISGIIIHGQAFLIPKYPAENIPEKIKEYNFNAGNINKTYYKKIKLALYKNHHTNKIAVCLVKIRFAPYSINSAITQDLNLLHTNDWCLIKFRTYFQPYKQAPETAKSYILLEYNSWQDCFDWIINENSLYNETCLQALIRINDDKKTQYMRSVLAVLLETISFHNYGIIHLDIKPENILINENKIKILDLEEARFFAPEKAIDYDKLGGTAAYAAPELQTKTAKNFNLKNDVFSCGISIRQMLYPVQAYTKEFGWIFNFEILNFNHEQYLRPHFYFGIMHNYGQHVADSILSLCTINHENRESLPNVFCKLALIYPALAHEIYINKLNEYNTQLGNILQTYPQAKAFLHNILSFANQANDSLHFILSDSPKTNLNIGNAAEQCIAINSLIRLQLTCQYLKVYELCNGELMDYAKNNLHETLTELFTRPDIKIEQLEQYYFPNKIMQETIYFHHHLRHLIMDGINNVAKNIVYKGFADFNDLKIKSLISLQFNLRAMWHNKAPLIDILHVFAYNLNYVFSLFSHKDSFYATLQQLLGPWNAYCNNVVYARQLQLFKQQSPSDMKSGLKPGIL